MSLIFRLISELIYHSLLLLLASLPPPIEPCFRFSQVVDTTTDRKR